MVVFLTTVLKFSGIELDREAGTKAGASGLSLETTEGDGGTGKELAIELESLP
jgi:hypothetical protein